jgi:hypothetical protein
MEASQENLDANMEANQEKMEAKMDTVVNAVREKMEAVMKTDQEKMEAAISSIWSELKETVKNWLEDGLASVGQLIQGLSEEFVVKVEQMQLGLQAVMTSFDMRTKDLCKEFSVEIQESGN